MKKNVWIAGMTAILSAGLVWLAPVFTLADERIPDGVSVGAVSLSGLTEEEAEKQIESYVKLGRETDVRKSCQELLLTKLDTKEKRSIVLLLAIPLSIGFFFVRPYEEAAWATFYRDITAAPTEPDEAY